MGMAANAEWPMTKPPLTDLPNDDADGDEEEECGEEDGEEDEEVDLQLILPEVDGANEVGSAAADDQHVEAGGAQVVARLRQSDDLLDRGTIFPNVLEGDHLLGDLG